MEEVKKVEAETPPIPNLASLELSEKAVAQPPAEPKALAVVEKAPEPLLKKASDRDACVNLDRLFNFHGMYKCSQVDSPGSALCCSDIALAEVEKEKRLSFIAAWEESEKSKAENKAQKKLSAVAAWENSKKASVEAQLRKMEEQLEKKKADYGEKMKNKAALIHKQAEEERATVEAKRAEDILKVEEMGAKYRATGYIPKKLLGCF